MAYEKYNIESFMSAWFDKDYTILSEADFKIVYAEYLDSSGLFMSDDFEKQGFINHLNSRINSVRMFIRLQREFILEFDMPFIRDFDRFKEEYGYVLYWRDDIKEFEQQLKKVESREIKHTIFLEEKIKELNDSRKTNNKKEYEDETDDKLKKSRTSFIRMMNSLGKIGYKLDKKTTTVEELSLMIKQQMEESEEQSNRLSNGR